MRPKQGDLGVSGSLAHGCSHERASLVPGCPLMVLEKQGYNFATKYPLHLGKHI